MWRNTKMNNGYNFKDLLDSEIMIDDKNKKSVKFDKIEIPKIQRDYAHGRKEKKGDKLELNETAKQFIEKIFSSLSENKVMDMDFVYGSITELKDKTFIPLDGQQRLTTLFLLYWYIGSRELVESDHANLTLLLRKFTYSTRVSSRRFCERLCDIKETKLEFIKEPSKEINNLFWFFSSYKKDPTISAMLNMLDEIHKEYSIQKNFSLYKNLANLKFHILPLDGFDLTEDLYIKMNARGKPLTDYENFKADLIKWMKDDCNYQKAKFDELVTYDNREMPYHMAISQKIDQRWTDFFWTFTKNEENKLIDDLFMRFIYRYFLNMHIKKHNAIEKEDAFIISANEARFQSFDVFENILDYDEIVGLELILDILSEKWNQIKNSISPYWFDDNQPYSFLNKKITQHERIIFLGITLYLEKNTFNENNFKQWMRIVWNLTENTDVSSFSSMRSVMILLQELASESEKIYAYLSKNPEMKSGSSKDALTEEKLKCQFIFQNNEFNKDWEDAFINAEKHSFFKGSIGFLISDSMTIDEFNKRTYLAEKVFDKNGINQEYRKDGHIFLRALISKYHEYGHIDWKYFTDINTEGHFKKKLASDEIIKKTIREWFSLDDEDSIKKSLQESIENESQMTGWDTNNPDTQRRMKRIHEILYKQPELQEWMQQKRAIRLGWRGYVLYISRYNARYDWILIDGYRNEIIAKLINNYNCFTQNQCEIGNKKIPFFHGNDKIILTRIVNNHNKDITFKYIFDAHNVSIGSNSTKNPNELTNSDIQKNSGDFFYKTYNYQSSVMQEKDIDIFLEKIENEIFDLGNQNSLVTQLKIF